MMTLTKQFLRHLMGSTSIIALMRMEIIRLRAAKAAERGGGT